MIFKMIAIGSVLLLAACTPVPAQRTEQSSNPGYKIDFLFEHEGCKVYRFYDPSYGTRYFSNCQNGKGKVFWSESCGKGCIRDHEI